MESKGILKDAIWIGGGKYRLTIDVDEPPDDELIGKEVRCKVTKWCNRRSLQANAYAWELISQMARKLNSTKEEVYEHLIQAYSTPITDDNGDRILYTVSAQIDLTKNQLHWHLITTSGDGRWNVWECLKGSSEFDTKEMTYFIERIIEEAKGLGIDTITPAEKEEMMRAYEKHYRGRQ